MARPGRPPGLPKTGGRVKKSLDKQQRQLVSAELAHSILATFEMLGGTAAMVEWAADNKSVFYTQILSRLMPAPQRADDDTGGTYTQINVGQMSEIEIASRVAFALRLGIEAQQELLTPSETIEPDYISPGQWTPPTDAPDMPEPVDDDRARWAAELPLTPEERADNALVRETKQATLATYAGSSAEQGGVARQPVATRKPTVAEIRRRQLL